uniref:MADF domain-containing protein n=1 Tax=Caenorhabditis japonica TaxID=281687 RepID=A0A8R1IEZ0_CAEJA
MSSDSDFELDTVDSFRDENQINGQFIRKGAKFNAKNNYAPKRLFGMKASEQPEEEDVTQKKVGRKSKRKVGESYSLYPASQIAKFLQLIEEYPIIWDSSVDNSHRKELKMKVYDDIERECHHFIPRDKMPGKAARVLFEELSRDYRKHTLRIENSKSGSGTTESDFQFASNMEFLDGARHKREVRNAYVLGKSAVQMLETRCDSPKRKMDVQITTPKRSRTRDGQIDHFFQKMESSTNSMLDALKTSLSDRSGECSSKRVCDSFEQQVVGWSEVDRIIAEAKVITFIKNLKPNDYTFSSNVPTSDATTHPTSSTPSSSLHRTSSFNNSSNLSTYDNDISLFEFNHSTENDDYY